nr:PREDICTED: uncharacterized protein LOC103313008 isoform X2 [Tribolium castaneum]|eukprot:XP_015833858.1 PREDICTED: uncharacterized protein LOC103313008 isoform X2 [Tribolium castaneum]
MANFKTCVLLWFVIDVTSALDGTEDHTKLLTVKQILDGSVIRSCPGIDIYPHVVLTSAFCLRILPKLLSRVRGTSTPT